MRRDAYENRCRILLATYDAVAERGPSVPAAEIAERAGVATSTLYRHFPDRRVLLASGSVWGWQRFDALIRRRTARDPSRRALHGALAEVVDVMIGGDRYLQATGERVGRTPVEILPWKARTEATLAEVLERTAQAGETRSEVHAAGLLELVLSIRDECHARERLELLMDAVRPRSLSC